MGANILLYFYFLTLISISLFFAPSTQRDEEKVEKISWLSP